MDIQKLKLMTMKPPLFADEVVARLESDLLFARTAPHWISTIRKGDGAYEVTERMLQRIKNEIAIDNI